MIQPCVLPSNASPLVGGSEPAPRVLQEHSGNRQHSDFRFTQDYDHTCSSSLLSENTHPRLSLKTQPLFRPHHTSSHTQFRSSFDRHGYGRLYPTQAEKEAKARSLLRRFQSSESYAKYRSRQGKGTDKNGDQQKWPDHLENAFFRALVEYPPMGRKKSLFKEKQRGRNELIADWIEMATGQNRTRKQVSSHIQVLKPFVCNDPQIMAYLSKPTPDSEGMTRYHGAYVSNHATGSGLSRYPVSAPRPHNGRPAMHISVLGGVGKHGKLRDIHNVFEPVDFEMFVQRKLPSIEHAYDEVERLHTYTKQISSPWGENEMLSDWNQLAQKHPSLAALHTQRPIECNVIAAQASLALHSGPWTDRDGLPVASAGIELGISFHCRAGEIPRPFELICNNQFFERGKLIEQSNDVHQFKDDGTFSDIQIKFGSNFWVTALSGKYKEACESGPGNGSAFIASISATQDIVAKTVMGMERVMLIHWTFRQSTRPVGRTSWKRVILPPSVSALQYDSSNKSAPAEKTFNFNDDPMPNFPASDAPPQPALQSPFEYESGSGSATSSGTWTNALNDATGTAFATGTNMDVDLDNTFDFTGGNIDISYDPNWSLENFDTSTFIFDAPTEDYVADSAVHDYSQPWVGSYTEGFERQQTFTDNSFSASAVADSQNSGFGDYDVYDPHLYGAGQESQAFGGAGQEVIKEEDMSVIITDAPNFTMAVVTETQETAQ